jgi:hypothetical protein
LGGAECGAKTGGAAAYDKHVGLGGKLRGARRQVDGNSIRGTVKGRHETKRPE